MLESMTIFTTGGLILYQYCAQPSLVKHNSTDTDADTTSTSPGGEQYTRHLINTVLMEQFLLPEYQNYNSNNTSTSTTSIHASNKSFHITDGMTLYWKKHVLSSPSSISTSSTTSTTTTTIYVVAIYPDILFEGPRQYLKAWAERLVQITIDEYDLYYTNAIRVVNATVAKQVSDDTDNNNNTTSSSNNNNNASSSLKQQHQHRRPDPKVFDKTFNILLTKSKTERPTSTSATTSTTSTTDTASSTVTNTSTTTNTATNNNKKNEKVQRNWYDSGKNTKITEKAMAALDRSNLTNTNNDTNNSNSNTSTDIEQIKQEQYERALRDARSAYLPSDQEIQNQKDNNTNNTSTTKVDQAELTQSSWIVGILQQVMGTKVLTTNDLQVPIQKIVSLLQEKNVSLSVAQQIGTSIQQQLVGKTLNSFYTIQTAVQQALETIITNILSQSSSSSQSNNTKSKTNSIDLIQNVINKRNSYQNSIWSSVIGTTTTNTSSGKSKRRPYVITVMGINGIGKTTTIAKLAYYFQQNKCTPLLVAGDTFRSGAIEQLRIHADCLNVPLFQQGYAKDPSSVASAAISYATEQQYDIVLIDTAGRMQNNVPLMKSLNKLMVENQPDYCIMVCEAIVGHDGIHQFQMFQKALGNSRKVDGIILTKFDTIDTKVGTCLTLTYECQTPILFLGVGQKYHHLQPLNVSTIIKGLFA